MRLGGLFSGIGGFELAWTRLGGTVAWMCEVDPKARKVLEGRFPGVPVYPDVRELDPAEVEAVDVLTGGSPCQGFSVAGQRQGLLHGESRLFADYVRIVDGLAARGLQYALWENVPGVLSIKNPDGERTFPHVIGALAGGGTAVRLDPRRKWNVGLATNGERAVSWRVLDSRYFGVAQRRRRVFACVAFGDSAADRAGRALLAVAEGVRGDSPASEPQGEGVAGGLAAGVRSASAFNWQSGGDARGLQLTDQTSGLTTQQTPAVLMTMREGKPGGGEGPLLTEEESLTLATGNGQTLFQPQAFDEMNFTTGDDTHHVLRAGTKQSTGVVVPQAFRKSRRAQTSTDDETWVEDGQANTLNVFDQGDTRTTHAIVEPTLTAHETGQGWWNEADHAGTLRAEGENRPSRPSNIMVQQYGVRRLTPVECERLQAFPDGWTEPAGSDSARYKALGNAVTVNTVGWILRRIKELS